MQRVLIVLAVSLCGLPALGAQEQNPKFEVASIRHNLSGSQSFGVTIKPGGTTTARRRMTRVVSRVRKSRLPLRAVEPLPQAPAGR